MKEFAYLAVGALIALPASGWAQQQDLEVTISVVPADAAPQGVTGEIMLPEKASPQAQESSAFGLGIANQAREMRGELGRQFGKDTSDAARERALTRGAGHAPGRP
jgi:hypothetical protein